MESVNQLRKWKTQADNCLKIVQQINDALMSARQPADRTLMKICRADRRYGSRDRRFFYRAVFAYYRWLGWIRHSALADAALPRQLFAALAAEHDAVFPPGALIWAEELGFTEAEVNGILALPGPLERFQAAGGIRDVLTIAQLAPDWTIPELAPGADARFIVRRPPVWVRVVPGAEETVLAAWKKAALEPVRHPLVTTAWHFDPGSQSIRFEEMAPWREGKFEVQDLSSQCIGLAADAHDGEHWFDPCAGGGGKTLQLCAMMHGRGSVTVYDIRARKLEELHERAGRTPFRRMIRTADSDLPDGLFDGVLLDAPCSSSGRWRRNPDARWALRREDLEDIISTQSELLNKYAPCVRPGGKLVFGTCSVFFRENAGNAARFLAAHPEFEPVPFPSPHNGNLQTDGMLQTFPADSDCDGSFVAVFRRKKT